MIPFPSYDLMGVKNNHPEWACQYPGCRWGASYITNLGIRGRRVYLCRKHKHVFIEDPYKTSALKFQDKRKIISSV